MADLTSAEGVTQFLKQHGIDVVSVQEVNSGYSNYVFRVQTSDGSTLICKHAQLYLKFDNTVSLSTARIEYEAKGFSEINAAIKQGLIPPTQGVQVPELILFDKDRTTIVTTDGGSQTLKDAYSQPGYNVSEYGRLLGSWLARLHCLDHSSKVQAGDNQTAKQISRFSYTNLHQSLAEYGLDPEFGQKVDAQYGGLLALDNECLCHGDFWPGNILVGPKGELPLSVVDWEMVRWGYSATDVAQFAAEAFLLDTVKGGHKLLEAFLQSYLATTHKSRDLSWAERVVVHFGVHIAYWPSLVSWGSRQETAKIIETGVQYVRHAMDKDWAWLSKSAFAPLFQALLQEHARTSDP